MDDLDEVLELLDGWESPTLDRRAQARLALAAAGDDHVVTGVDQTGDEKRPDVTRTADYDDSHQLYAS